MKKIVAIIILAHIFSVLFAQGQTSNKERSPKVNSIQLDLGSYGFLCSVHYERILLNFNKFTTSGRLGFTAQKELIPEDASIFFPFEFNEFCTIKNHHLEVRLGFIVSDYFNYVNWSTGKWTFFDRFTGRIGYRYQKPGGKVLFRIGFTPCFYSFPNYTGDSYSTSYKYRHSFGIAIGYCF